MTFGEDWGWGASVEESVRMLNRYVELGGNFIDTGTNSIAVVGVLVGLPAPASRSRSPTALHRQQMVNA
jgi:hypothetical protein